MVSEVIIQCGIKALLIENLRKMFDEEIGVCAEDQNIPVVPPDLEVEIDSVGAL